jgi:hypothetical protein
MGIDSVLNRNISIDHGLEIQDLDTCLDDLLGD